MTLTVLLVRRRQAVPSMKAWARVQAKVAMERPMIRASSSASRNGQAWSRGSGTGTLEGARGGSYSTDGVVALSGEIDIFGRPWSSRTWAARSWRTTLC